MKKELKEEKTQASGNVKMSSTVPQVLVHICCAADLSVILQRLKEKFNITGVFFNPNIYPEKELFKREEYSKQLCEIFNIPYFFHNPINYEQWKRKIIKYKDEKEKGKRCQLCINLRLRETAKIAKKSGFKFFTTCLSVSPKKDYMQIYTAGKNAEKKFKIKFLADDFKKNNGFALSLKLCKKYNIYRQSYCGCEFSLNNSTPTGKKNILPLKLETSSLTYPINFILKFIFIDYQNNIILLNSKPKSLPFLVMNNKSKIKDKFNKFRYFFKNSIFQNKKIIKISDTLTDNKSIIFSYYLIKVRSLKKYIKDYNLFNQYFIIENFKKSRDIKIEIQDKNILKEIIK